MKKLGKIKWKYFIIFGLLGLMLGSIAGVQSLEVEQVQAVQSEVIGLEAVYDGNAVVVGKEFDLSKLKVIATYYDGERSEIIDYSIATRTVTQEGSNQFLVAYEGKTAYFYVTGKRIVKLYASYLSIPKSVGNSVGKKEVTVYAQCSDGTTEQLTDFQLYNNVITTLGENEVYVSCEDQLLSIKAWGVEPKEVVALHATYSGAEVSVGNSVQAENLVVTATHKDGSVETIYNYVLTPEVIGAIGNQKMAVYYRGKTTTFHVVGQVRQIVRLTATYRGNPVGVGYSVRPADVYVTAIYQDGAIERVTDFNLLSATIGYVGFHTVTVEAQGHKAEILVEGIAEQMIDFSQGSEFTISNGVNTGKVSIAIPKNVGSTSLMGKSISNTSISRLLTRTIRKSTYLTFTIEEMNEEISGEFPLTMKIQIPKEFNLARTHLYYTPNKKSILAKMNAQRLGPDYLIVKIYHSGTYILTLEN